MSRIGGKTQLPAYRVVAGPLRLAYSQFEELETFARFATRLDDQTRAIIERGRRVPEALRQYEHAPLAPAEQIAVLYAVTEGLLDRLGHDAMPRGERAICDTLRQRCGDLFSAIEGWRETGTERIRVFFNRHISTTTYEPTTLRVVPVDFERFRGARKTAWESRVLPTFSMDRTSLLAALLRQYFFVTVFSACAESLASENGARLAAMRAAEKNLSERQTELMQEFRRVHQDRITTELLDLFSGFETVTASEPRS